jgi:Zn ribbon nucleic-acid-binding protein
MALVTCYDPQGVAHEKEPVDARECVAQCGYSMSAPQAVTVAEDAPEKRTYPRKAKE